MRIYVLREKFCRCLLFGLVLLLSLPLLLFYARQAVNPETVLHLKPRGDALKVYLDTGQSARPGGSRDRIFNIMREYYQNGF